MKFYLVFLFHLLTLAAKAQLNIVPRPAEENNLKGPDFIFSDHTIIYYDKLSLKKSALYFQQELKADYGLTVKTLMHSSPENYASAINLSTGPKGWQSGHGKEYYNIYAVANGMSIVAQTPAGIFYAIQTIRQCMRPAKSKMQFAVPPMSFSDYPRFAYRGMHLDVSRHFFSVAEVKNYIDWLAYYKFNSFHWHLTDDQGWRIEIKKYPLLTQVGGCRAQTLVGNYGSKLYDGKKYCGWYTQEQIREVVRYAAAHFITIIPEIEMPGHATAALASYPYLGCTKGPYKTMETWGVSDDVFCAGNDSTYTFIENVLAEVCGLFPSQYIHIGGDECPKTSWKNCAVCRQKMKAENLKDENELQSYFVKRLANYLTGKGKKIIGWDEILDGGLPANATVMSWRGEDGGVAAAKQGYNVIMTPGAYCYFDHSQSANEDSLTIGGYLPLEKVYGYEPVAAGLSADEEKHITGAQANIWTEYISNESKLQYMVFPRMAALAEVLWSPKEKRDWKNFAQRLPAIFKDYNEKNVHYSKAYYDLQAKMISLPGNKIGWKIETNNDTAKIIFRVNGHTSEYTVPVEINESGMYEAAIVDERENLISNWVRQEIQLNKATGKKITLANAPADAYAGSGAFSLVDGVQNRKGMARSSEFLGFLGKDLDAVIDLGEETAINKVALHVFIQQGSWIYPPANVEVMTSDDGIQFSAPLHLITEKPVSNDMGTDTYSASINANVRYIKLVAKNFGIIPPGNAGAGEAAWLFADEVEVF